MEPYSAFLLSMQAAGVVTSIWQNKGAQKQIQLGRDLEKASLDANLAANNFEFQESSLASMQALRQNLGTQAVMQAARGNAAGTESAVGSPTKINLSYFWRYRSKKNEYAIQRIKLKGGQYFIWAAYIEVRNRTWALHV
jgi:hypothetical protein